MATPPLISPSPAGQVVVAVCTALPVAVGKKVLVSATTVLNVAWAQSAKTVVVGVFELAGPPADEFRLKAVHERGFALPAAAGLPPESEGKLAMGLRLPSATGTAAAPPLSSVVPAGQVAVTGPNPVAERAEDPTSDADWTTVAPTPPLRQTAEAVTVSFGSAWPPKPPRAVHTDGSVVPLAAVPSPGSLPFIFNPLV
jgi:hypothetical protein